MPTIADPVPMLLPVARAAKVSGISKSELYRRIQCGKLSAKLVGGKMRILFTDLMEMVQALPNLGD